MQLVQTLTMCAAFASSTYLLPQIPGPGRSSDDDLLNSRIIQTDFFRGHPLSKGAIRPPCAPERMATASLFFGRHLRMPWQIFGRCFFALSSPEKSLPLSDVLCNA